MAGMSLPVLRGKILEEARSELAESEQRSEEKSRMLQAARRELHDFKVNHAAKGHALQEENRELSAQVSRARLEA